MYMYMYVRVFISDYLIPIILSYNYSPGRYSVAGATLPNLLKFHVTFHTLA